LWAVSLNAFSSDRIQEIDLSEFLEKDNTSNEVTIDYMPESNVRVQAGYNVVHWEGERGTKFYPLFQIINQTGSDHKISIGMQLLDKNKKVLIKASHTKVFPPSKGSEPSYENSLSINAESITKEILEKTKYIKVLYGSKNV